VFPNTKHRFCLWHITNKFPEKTGHAYREPSTFKEDIDSIMHNTYEAVEFETKWMDLMKKHKLNDNVWMQGIFNIRQRWIPLWNVNLFYRDEQYRTDFVTKYEAALLEVYERESAEDFASEHRYHQVGSHQALLKDATKLYTRTMFHKLQDQFDQVVRFLVIERHVEDNVQKLTVKSHSGRTESFELQIDLEKITSNYGCNLFEYVGLPCCHILKVFSKYNILKMPEAFIMTRWTIGANKFLRSYDENSLVSGTMILNPLVVQTKGQAKIDHKKGARWKRGIEEAVMKKKRTCKSCGVLSNHDKRTCPLLKTMIAESRDNNNGESV
ncbi:hypothetical protein GIB67_034071, partial [Kingdonia uniflora]